MGRLYLTVFVSALILALGFALYTRHAWEDYYITVRASKNLASSQWLAPEGLNVYDILRHQTVVLTHAAAKAVEAALLGAAEGKD